MGDLNYRISLSYNETRNFLQDNNWSSLLEKDQVGNTLINSDCDQSFELISQTFDSLRWKENRGRCSTVGMKGTFTLLRLINTPATPMLTPEKRRKIGELRHGIYSYSVYFTLLGGTNKFNFVA